MAMSAIDKVLYRSPVLQAKNLWLNRLGFQIGRYLALQTLHGVSRAFARRTPMTPAWEEKCAEFLRNGICVVENFFDPDDLQYLDSIKNNAAEYVDQHNAIPQTKMRLLVEYQGRRAVVKDQRVLDIVMKKKELFEINKRLTGFSLTLPPKIYFLNQSVKAEDVGHAQTDYQDVLHYDVPYPTMKAIVYLDDVDATNGAFCFVKGSPKFSLRRARAEYDYSLANAHYQAHEKDRKPVSAKFYEPENLQQMPGKKNSMVLFNAEGFHKRGDFKKPLSRETLFIDFRPTFSLANFLLPKTNGANGRGL